MTNQKKIRTLEASINTSGVRKETFQGKEHYVLPVVAAVEGVLNGELLTAAAMSASLPAWEGVLVTMSHPKGANGEHVSANDKDAIEEYAVGRFFNVHVEDKSMKGEIWVDIESLQSHADGQKFIDAIEAGEIVEVSTAYFRKTEKVDGQYNGKHYSTIAYDLVPNHLAILVNEIGACSVKDGCGTPRTNEQEDKKMSFSEKVKELLEGLQGVVVGNEMAFRQIENALHGKIVEAEAPTDQEYVSVLAAYNDTVVYVKENFETGDYALYRRDYSIDGSDSVILGSDKVEVKQVVSFEPANNESEACGCTSSTVANTEETMDRDQIIADLAENEALPFTHDQLSAMDDAGLQFLADSVTENAEEQGGEEQVVETPQANAEAQLPAELVEALKTLGVNGLTSLAQNAAEAKLQADEERKGLIKSLVAHTSLTEEDMALLPISSLKRMARDNMVSYIGAGGAAHNEDSGEPTVPQAPKIVLADVS